MSVAGVIDDLITLQHLAEGEADPRRRRSLSAVRSHVAARGGGFKVSEAARVLQLSAPTVRAWIDSGVLQSVPGTRPVRIEAQSLASAKQMVDLLREQGHDRDLLVTVMRVLRDRTVLRDKRSKAAPTDLAAGRIVPLTDELLAELEAPVKKANRSTSN